MLLRPCIPRTVTPLSSCSRSRLAAMPLKARIAPGAMNRAEISTQAEIPKELPDDAVDNVLFDTIYGVRTIELNRPRKLNSLNGLMARKIIPRLKEWEKSQMANVIIIKGAGEKAFCAGGDVAALARYNQQGPKGQQKSKDYFGLEYKLDHLIATYTKPYIAFMDGITMGGGVGLSVHAPFRIATERTVFAMPETTIGFFPDVGATFFLPRLDGMVGTYLALTSEQLTGVNVFYAGIATHYMHSSSLADLQARLAELKFKDYASLQERYEIINHTMDEFFTGFPHDKPMRLAGETREAIDRCFKFNTINEIKDALKYEPSRKWASKTLDTLENRSPTSLRVALHQMRIGRQWGIAEVFEREHAIASHFMEHNDFVEGVTAKLIDKRKKVPQWQILEEGVTDAEVVEPFFKTEGKQRLQLLDQGDRTNYKDYPHAWIGLPREVDVERVVREGSTKREDVIEYFASLKNEKPGTREKVEEILARKTTEDGVSNALTWRSSA